MHRGPQLQVGEIPPPVAAALDQLAAQAAAQRGELQRIPGQGRLARQQDSGCARQQVAEVGLPPPRPAQRHQAGEGPRPPGPIDLFGPFQQRAVERLQIGRQLGRPRQQQFVQVLAGPVEVVGVQQVQLLHGQRQPQRVAVGRLAIGARAAQHARQHVGVDLAMVAPPHVPADVCGLGSVQRRHGHGLDAGPPGERLGLRAGQPGGDETGVGRPGFGQPGLVAAARGGLELIQRIHQHDHAAPGGRAAQKRREGLLDLVHLAGRGQRRALAQGGRQLRDPTPQHGLHLAGAGCCRPRGPAPGAPDASAAGVAGSAWLESRAEAAASSRTSRAKSELLPEPGGPVTHAPQAAPSPAGERASASSCARSRLPAAEVAGLQLHEFVEFLPLLGFPGGRRLLGEGTRLRVELGPQLLQHLPAPRGQRRPAYLAGFPRPSRGRSAARAGPAPDHLRCAA